MRASRALCKEELVGELCRETLQLSMLAVHQCSRVPPRKQQHQEGEASYDAAGAIVMALFEAAPGHTHVASCWEP